MKLTNYENEDWRTERLRQVRSLVEFHGMHNIIERLHDHKGQLQVYWNDKPTGEQLENMITFWQVFNEYDLEHYLVQRVEVNECKLLFA